MCWVSEWVRLWMGPLRGELWFLIASYPPLLELCPTDFQSHIKWGLVFPVQGRGTGSAQSGAWTWCSLGRASTPVICLLFVGSLSSSFQTTGFFLGLRASETTYEPFKRGICFIQHLGTPVCPKTLLLQVQYFQAHFSFRADPRYWGA